jgi:hypothetical protein
MRSGNDHARFLRVLGDVFATQFPACGHVGRDADSGVRRKRAELREVAANDWLEALKLLNAKYHRQCAR